MGVLLEGFYAGMRVAASILMAMAAVLWGMVFFTTLTSGYYWQSLVFGCGSALLVWHGLRWSWNTALLGKHQKVTP